MFDRLQRTFMTVDTGEAYQPICLVYEISRPDSLAQSLNTLKCLVKNPTSSSWNWYWQEECNDLHFESLDAFRRSSTHPTRLGTVSLKDSKLYINLPSFKRACIAVPFFHKTISQDVVCVHHADFINKVFAVDERLPHGFSELFKEEELDRILHQRAEDYEKVKEQCEEAETADQAFALLADYTNKEMKKRLPYAERYVFDTSDRETDPDITFLAFYIFLRGRELVAIKRWFGQSGYSLADASDELMDQVFGGLGVDLIE